MFESLFQFVMWPKHWQKQQWHLEGGQSQHSWKEQQWHGGNCEQQRHWKQSEWQGSHGHGAMPQETLTTEFRRSIRKQFARAVVQVPGPTMARKEEEKKDANVEAIEHNASAFQEEEK